MPLPPLALVASLALSPAPAVEVTYLGTAGWQIRAGETVLLVDPYYSRLPQPKDEDRIAPDAKAIAAHAPARAALVLVSHAHWDHLLDAPSVALRAGAQLLGSESSARFARASGLSADRIIPVRGGEDYELEGFSVRVIPSLHSALHDKHWLDSEPIAADPKLPLRVMDFHDGGTFAFLIRIAGHRLLFVSSANFIERELEGARADVAFIAPGLREEIHDYTCRLLAAAGKPRLVFTTHHDDFAVSYDEVRATHDQTVRDLAPFLAEVRACAPGTDARVPRHLEPVRLPDARPIPGRDSSGSRTGRSPNP